MNYTDKDPYAVMGLPYGAGREQIKKRYRELVKKYHPDLHPGDETAGAKMSEINEAYEAIRNGDVPYYSTSARTAPETSYDEEDILSFFSTGPGSESSSYGGYDAVDSAIARGDIHMAAVILNTLPRNTAKWHLYAAKLYSMSHDEDMAELHRNAAGRFAPDNGSRKEEGRSHRLRDVTAGVLLLMFLGYSLMYLMITLRA